MIMEENKVLVRKVRTILHYFLAGLLTSGLCRHEISVNEFMEERYYKHLDSATDPDMKHLIV